MHAEGDIRKKIQHDKDVKHLTAVLSFVLLCDRCVWQIP